MKLPKISIDKKKVEEFSIGSGLIKMSEGLHAVGSSDLPVMSRNLKTEKGLGLGLDHIKIGLQLLANVAGGGINIPGLQSVAQIALQIVDTAQNVNANREESANLAEQVVDLMCLLIESMKGKSDADTDTGFKNALVKFGKELECVQKILLDLTSHTTFDQVVNHESNSGSLVRCRDMLDRSFKTFMVYLGIASHMSMEEIKQTLKTPSTSILAKNHQLSSTPPPAPAVFFGRDAYIDQAVSLIQTAPPARLAILGSGGMGKTCAALAILHHQAIQDMFQDRCYFVPCDAATTSDLLLSSLLQVLGIQPVTTGDALTALHNFLVHSPALILVFDNFETPWESEYQTEVDSILQRVSAVKHLTLIVTMRGSISPSGLKWTLHQSLHPLSLDAARAAFLAMAGKSEAEAELDSLLQELDCVPLAVKLIAQLAKTPQTCKSLLKQWKKRKTSLLHAHDHRSDRLTSIEVSISLSLKSFSVSQEDPEATQLLTLIAHLPDGVLKWEERLETIFWQFGNAEHVIGVLLKAALLYVDAAKTLKILSPIRHYMLKYQPAEMGHIAKLERYYIDLIHSAKSSRNVKELQPELGNITSVLKYALQTGAYRDAVEAAYDLTELTINVQPSLDLITEALSYIRSLDMSAMEPDYLLLMGNILYYQSKYAEAKVMVKEASSHFTLINNQLGAAKCLKSLGDILYMQSQYTDAMEKLEEARAQLILIDQLEAVKCLQSLGNIFYMQSKYKEAEETLEKAKKQFMVIGNLSGVAECQRSLGDVFRMQSKYTEAEENLIEANAYFVDNGNRSGAAECLKCLGNIFYMQSQFAGAKEKLEEAKALFILINDLSGAAHCIQSLGFTLSMQCNYAEANQRLEEAKAQFTLIDDLSGVANCLKGLGNILYMESRYAEAKEKLEEAEKMLTHIGSHVGAAECMSSLGNILYMQSRYTEAQEKLKGAEKQFSLIGNLSGSAHCLKVLGNIFFIQSKYMKAQEELERAKAQFIHNDEPLGAAECQKCLGDILCMHSRYSEAKMAFDDAKAQFSHMGNYLGVAECLTSLGKILYRQSRYAESKQMLEEAESQFTLIGEPSGATECLLILGNIFTVQSQYKNANETLMKAKKQFDALGEPVGSSQCLLSLGNLLLMQSKHVEAEEYLNQAKANFTAFGMQLEISQCSRSLGVILRLQSHHAEARKMLEEATKCFTDLGDKLSVAECLYQLGELSYVQGVYSEAENWLNKANELFILIGNLQGEAKCLQSISNLSLITGNFVDAKENLEKAKKHFHFMGNDIDAAQCQKGLDDITNNDLGLKASV